VGLNFPEPKEKVKGSGKDHDEIEEA
jgi:hypothetical protein